MLKDTSIDWFDVVWRPYCLDDISKITKAIANMFIKVAIEKDFSAYFQFSKKCYICMIWYDKIYQKGILKRSLSSASKTFLINLFILLFKNSAKFFTPLVPQLEKIFADFNTHPDVYFVKKISLSKSLEEYSDKGAVKKILRPYRNSKDTQLFEFESHGNVKLHQMQLCNAILGINFNKNDTLEFSTFDHFFVPPFLFEKIDYNNTFRMTLLKTQAESTLCILPLFNYYKDSGFIHDVKLDKGQILFKEIGTILNIIINFMIKDTYFVDFEAHFNNAWSKSFGKGFLGSIKKSNIITTIKRAPTEEKINNFISKLTRKN